MSWWPNFPSKGCHFQYDDIFLCSREMGTVEIAKRQDFCNFSSCLEMKNNLEKVFPFLFLQNVKVTPEDWGLQKIISILQIGLILQGT